MRSFVPRPLHSLHDFAELTAQNYRIHTSDFHDAPLLAPAFQPRYRTPPELCSFAQLPTALLETVDEAVPAALQWATNRHCADPELSIALLQEGRIAGHILCGDSADGGYVLLAAHNRPNAPATAFLTLLLEMLNRCYYRGGDYPLYFSATSDHVSELALRLMRGQYTSYNEYTREFSFGAHNSWR